MSTTEAETRLGLVNSLMSTSMGLGNWSQLIRAAIATTIAFIFGSAISTSETAILAPLTAMLVVQSSAFATVGETLQRIVGTAVGVAVASVYVNLLGGSMIVFAGGVLLALVLVRLMPLAMSARAQVAISMLFVLTIGPGEWISDVGRILDTLVGGLVGMAAVFVFPPKTRLEPALAAFATWYEGVAKHLEAMGHGIGHQPVPRGERHAFVANSFQLRQLDLDAREAFAEAVESVQFNPRARKKSSEKLDLMERDLRWITSVTVQVRALSGEIDRLYDREGGLPPALNPAMLSALLVSLAQLMRAEVRGRTDRSTIERRARRVQGLIAESTSMVTYGRRDVTEVLQSVTLLGRIDALARTIHGGPARLAALPWDAHDPGEARRPLPAPTGMMPALGPEDDPTMTIGLPAITRPPDAQR